VLGLLGEISSTGYFGLFMALAGEMALILVSFNDSKYENLIQEVIDMSTSFPDNYTGNVGLRVKGVTEVKNVIFTIILLTLLFLKIKSTNFSQSSKRKF
jgi:hypothetical protein